VKHVGAIAGRELRSLFASPVAYAVLVLFSVLGGFFFLSGVLLFVEFVSQLQMMQMTDRLSELNLNDHVVAPFYQVMSVVLLILIPAVTMSLFAAEKSNGTQELLLTSPITIGELVVGKFIAAATFVAILVGMLGVFPAILFLFGDPELGRSAAGLAGLLLLGWAYAAIGTFASAVTRSQLIAFFLSLALLLVLLLIGFVAERGLGAGVGVDLLRYLSTSEHFETIVMGLIDTKDIAYFGVMTAAFLLLAKSAVESVRWR
jgi:ABC-2 type transport system permease protein